MNDLFKVPKETIPSKIQQLICIKGDQSNCLMEPWKPVGVPKAKLGVEGPQQINWACNHFYRTAKIRARRFYFLSFKVWQYSVPGCRNLIGQVLPWSIFPTQPPNPEDNAAKQKNGPESSPHQNKWNSSSSESRSRDARKDRHRLLPGNSCPVTLSRRCGVHLYPHPYGKAILICRVTDSLRGAGAITQHPEGNNGHMGPGWMANVDTA